MTEGISVPIGEIKVEALDEAEAAAARAEAFRDEAELASSSAAGSASTATSAKNAAVAAQETVLDARDEAIESAANALQFRDEADSYQSLAEQSKDESVAASQTSVAASEVAVEARADAVHAAATATAAATSADQDAVAAAGSRSGAEAAQNSATNSASDAATSAAAADAYADEAAAEKAEAQTARQGAETAAGNSASSATQARNAELSALAAQAAAEASQADALASAGVATTKAGEASTSAADADADRIAAQTALADAVAAKNAAEAAKNAIPSMPVLATNRYLNPRLGVNSTGWSAGFGTGGSGTASRVAAGGPNNSAYYQMVFDVAGAGVAQMTIGGVTPVGSVVVGDTVSVKFWVWSSVARNASFVFDWLGVSGNYIVGTTIAAPLSASAWTEITLSAPVPTNAGVDRFAVQFRGGSVAFSAGDTIRATLAIWDKVPASALPSYFDGASAGARWTGTAHASASELVVARASDLDIRVSRNELSAQAVNLAKNPSATLSVPGGEGGGTGTISLSTARSLFGSTSARFEWASGSRGISFGSMVNNNLQGNFTLSAGTWTLTAYVFSESGAVPSMHLLDSAYQPLPAGQILDNTSTPVAGQWTRVRWTVSLPSPVSLRWYGVLGAAGVYYVDGVMVHSGERPLDFFDSTTGGSRLAADGTSELVVPRPTDLDTRIRETARFLEGTGSPEGAVRARPGTEYLDNNGTNGAWVWRKRTGTGATGWAVSDGDTGWRTITSWTTAGVVTGEALSASWAPGSGQAGYIRARRSGSTLEVAIVGLERLNTTNANVWATYVLPLGMRPAIAINSTYIVNNVSGVGAQIALGGAGTISRAFGVGAGVNGLIYQTTIVGTADPAQPWPTGNLPGTAT